MQVVAKLNYLRIAPRKVRLVADLIRKKKIEEAQTILNFTVKKASQSLLKLLNSAVANARNNFQVDPNNLYISKITVDEGPKYKRWMPRARGRASEIQKKTSHVTLVLDYYPLAVSKKPSRRVAKRPESRQRRAPEVEKKLKKVKKKEKRKEKKKEEVKESPKIEKPKTEKPKLRPQTEFPKPKIGRGIKRIFRRKAF